MGFFGDQIKLRKLRREYMHADAQFKEAFSNGDVDKAAYWSEVMMSMRADIVLLGGRFR